MARFFRKIPYSRRCTIIVLSLLSTMLAACVAESARSVRLTENLISGEVPPPISTDISGWVFGFDRRLEPKDDVRQIASLINWLGEKTGFSFKIDVTLPGKSVVSDICDQQVDFAVVGTVSYLQANHLCGARILVRGVNLKRDDQYQAAIIVPVDSSIEALGDLKGCSFAFGAPNSTQGYLIPRLMLQKSGLGLDDLGLYAFHDSHATTANAVTSGRFDAGAVQDTLAYDLEERGLVRILALSDLYPSSGIIVGAHVPPKTASMIRDVLLSLDPFETDAASLYEWDRTEMPGGFALADDGDYDELRQAAKFFGLLEP